MSKRVVVVACLTGLCCALVLAQGKPRISRVLVVAVSVAGSPARAGPDDGSSEHPFRTIQAAVDVALPGDTVRVTKGVYRNPDFGTAETDGPVVLITKGGSAEDGPLTLLGEPGAVIEYDGSGGILAGKGVSYVTIQNFVVKGPAAGISASLALQHRLDNPARSKYNGQGIAFPGPSHHINIVNNVVTDACSSGIRVNQGDYVSIQENRVSNSTGCTASASSALVIAQATNVDDVDAVKIHVLGNTVFDNRNRVPFSPPTDSRQGPSPPSLPMARRRPPTSSMAPGST